MRLSYSDSCSRLQKLGYLEQGTVPPLPKRVPQYDDSDPLGVRFFRTRVENDRLENLTLTRTFFGRSEILKVSFRNTDLSESNFCWNDFVDVDFTDSCLESSDLRSSTFLRTRFIRSNLKNADLRRSSFEGCDFEGAHLEGVTLHDSQKALLRLSADQIRQIAWTSDEGPEPGGG